MANCTLNDIRASINSISRIYIISQNSVIINELNKSLEKLSSIENTNNSIFSNFFNDNSIQNGQEINKIKGDSFCEYFKEYNYSKIRDLIYKNLPGQFCISFDLQSLIDTANQYQYEFSSNPPTVPVGSEKTAEEIFWSSKQSAYLSLLNQLTTKIDSCQSGATNTSAVIVNWINFGQNSLMKVSACQSYIQYKDKLINNENALEVLMKSAPNISRYCQQVVDHATIASEVVKSNPNKKIGELNSIVKKTVLTRLNFASVVDGYIKTVEDYFKSNWKG